MNGEANVASHPPPRRQFGERRLPHGRQRFGGLERLMKDLWMLVQPLGRMAVDQGRFARLMPGPDQEGKMLAESPGCR